MLTLDVNVFHLCGHHGVAARDPMSYTLISKFFVTMISPSPSQHHRHHGTDPTIRAEFKRRVATLDSEVARSLYRELASQLVAFEALEIVLDRLIELDGTEATDRFIDTVE